MKKDKKSVACIDDDQRVRRTHAETEEELRVALRTIKESGETVSISAVAAEVGVTPGLIHNKYQTVANEIRALTGRTTSVRLTDVQQQLKEALERNADLRQENTDLLKEVQELASVNESLRQRLAVAKAMDSGKVVRLPKS